MIRGKLRGPVHYFLISLFSVVKTPFIAVLIKITDITRDSADITRDSAYLKDWLQIFCDSRNKSH